MPRVSILFDNFGPYHLARIQHASRVCDLLAVEFGSRSEEYMWSGSIPTGVAHKIVNQDGSGSAMPEQEFKQRLFGILDEFRPDVVAVPGWATRGAFLGMQWAGIKGVPVIMMSESMVEDEPRVRWKEWLKTRIVGMAATALVGGCSHAEYIQKLGMPSTRVFLGYDAVNNEYFAEESAKYGSSETPWSGKFFLASNRFIDKKNLFRLLDAYAAYIKKSRHQISEFPLWSLCMLGDGELRDKLRAHCVTLGLEAVESAPWEIPAQIDSVGLRSTPVPVNQFTEFAATVFFPGFRQIDELPKFYAHAGAFVHASTTEQWGLVVNEAMACGLPVLVSERVGCVRDLVKPGKNGFIFDPLDAGSLTWLMKKVSGMSTEERETLGAASRGVIANWGPERFARGLKAAAEAAVERGADYSSFLDRAMLALLGRIQ